VAPFEVLWAVELFAPGAMVVELASAEGPRSVASGSGLALQATAVLDPEIADIVIVPGGVGPIGDPAADVVDDRSIPAILARTLDTDLPDLIARTMVRESATLACVCGGSLIPAMAGLLEGRPAVTHHLGMDLLEATGTRAIRARVVDDGDVITGGGVTSGLDVALHIVERFIGPKVAHAIEDMFEFERRGVVWRDTGPSPMDYDQPSD
jgi:transcriptional regulator GlxA family with amidase domain